LESGSSYVDRLGMRRHNKRVQKKAALNTMPPLNIKGLTLSLSKGEAQTHGPG